MPTGRTAGCEWPAAERLPSGLVARAEAEAYIASLWCRRAATTTVAVAVIGPQRRDRRDSVRDRNRRRRRAYSWFAVVFARINSEL